MGHKIKAVEIKNFRNIVYDNFVLDGSSVIIAGNNEIGKTNRLQAILWVLGSVMFDNTVRDTLSNITPDGANSDTITSVSITFTNGNEITKTYARPFELNSLDERVYKNSKTTYIVNGGKPLSRIADGEQFILEQLGLDKLSYDFKSNKALSRINLPFLFTTTKGVLFLDNNTLRELIIDIVGEVDVMELAKQKSIYNILVPELENKKGDINALREDIRYSIQNKSDGLEQQVFVAKKVLEDLELEAKKEINELEIKKAKEKIEILSETIKSLEVKKQLGKDEITKDVELNISKLENDILRLENVIKENHKKELGRFSQENNNNELNEKEKALKDLSYDVRGKEQDYKGLENTIQTYINEQNRVDNRINDIKVRVENLRSNYNELKTKETEKSGELITCPKCNETFDLYDTPENKVKIEKDVETQIKAIQNEVNELRVEKEQLDLKVLDLDKAITAKRNELTKATNEYSDKLKLRNELETQVVELRNKSLENDRLAPQLNLNTKEMLELKEQLKTLKNDKERVLNEFADVAIDYDVEIDRLKNKIAGLEEITLIEKVKDANLKSLQNKRLEYDKLVETLNTQLELYRLSKDLLVDMFKELENRVEIKFGKDVYFKLYEPNVSDGGETYKTNICEMYVRDSFDRLVPALANGVSTSMQEIRIIDFIERLKDYYNLADSVILLDRLESLDSNKRKELSKKNQIISTRVADNMVKAEYEFI